MILRKTERPFILFASVFLCLGWLYYLCYTPIKYVDGMKIFDPRFVQGDAQTYVNFAMNEISGHSFLEWYLKLNLNNISLVYFSWFRSLLDSIVSFEIFFNSALICALWFVVRRITVLFKKSSTFSAFSLLSSFSMLVYVQTYTKEVFILFFLLLALFAIAKKSYKLCILALFFLIVLRIYFALILGLSLLGFFAFKRNRKVSAIVAAVFLLCLPFLYIKIFPQFLEMREIHSDFGLYYYYLISMKQVGLYLFWLPFRIFQNICEPLWNLYRTPSSGIILEVATVLDLLTAAGMFLMMSLIWFLRRNLRHSIAYVQFLMIFIIVYIIVIGSLPIIHFRYFVPLLPILGLLVDMLRPMKENCN